ncbi:MAG TPA: ATP-binding protein, partial [Ktedonobacteraceae bacterium]|nr:ATP-binding protein [Ktedonobacteraceae bacterium]
MEAQDKQEDGIPASEVMTALLDLARLSQQGESAAFEAPEANATMLLERLLLLCKAQRGAILFTTQGPAEAYHALLFPPPSRKAFRTFALHRMNEEEAYALVADCSAEEVGADLSRPSPIYRLPGEPCWVICRLPISLTQSGGQVPVAQQEDNGQELSAAESSRNTFFPLYALLLLGWDGNEERACIEATKKGQAVLPLVMDSTGSALMNILLAERVHELETLADHKALREMELLKAELLATVSHELRSPLASIKGYAATLLRHERRISREERHEFLFAIAHASDRLQAVIERLLEVSQLETGAITIQRSSVDLAYLAREAIASIERYLEVSRREASLSEGQSRSTFILRLQDRFGMPTRNEPIIQADRNRLREVLDNLLENAIKYSPEGGTIEVVVRPLMSPGVGYLSPKQGSRFIASAGGPVKSDHDRKMGNHPSVPRSPHMVEICVRDNGIGIPAAHLERIFDRFHRVDTSLTREVNGIGLGLAICKRIV